MNSKRTLEDYTMRPRKISGKHVKMGNDILKEKEFHFRVILPNSTTIELHLSELRNEIPMEEFKELVIEEYDRVAKQRRSSEPNRRIDWEHQDIHFTDAKSKEIRSKVNLGDFTPNKWNLLWLHDDDDYAFETLIANLIDNSLHNVWSNGEGERRLISVELLPSRILIFDSGPGMDGAAGSLEKWGKVLASLHQSKGGKLPYSMPFFGMFDYRGSVATMCFRKGAVIFSKTKNYGKVLTLKLERESASCSENCWRTKGGTRDPLKDETDKSLHGSFTKVEIFEPKVKTLDIKHLRCKLKDIFFPFVKCAQVSGTASFPVEFQVNGIDLSEVKGCEEAVNLYSCNGPNFVVQLHFTIKQGSSTMAHQNEVVFPEANASLNCVYFPIVEGKENTMRTINGLDADGCGIRENLESFSRVSVRSSGRLLPNARWELLPFMEPKQKMCEKGHKTGIFFQVKCFIDTDSGFKPTSHKTDLDQHHPYTKALKNFGTAAPEIEKEVQVKISKDGKKLTLIELEEQYNSWIMEMHDRYDDEHNQKLHTSIGFRPAPYASRWKVLNYNKDSLYTVRVGSFFKPLYIKCVHGYNKCVLFTEVPQLNLELSSNGKVLAHIHSKKVDLEPGNSTMRIKDFFVRSSKLDDIRPTYEATLTISRADKEYSASFPCRVLPGTPKKINLHPPTLTRLIPSQIIKELSLEVLDEYGNHVEEGEIIFLRFEGLSFQNGSGAVFVGGDCMKKVDAHGYVNLSNSLKVTKENGKVSLSVIFNGKVIFQQRIETESRDIKSVQKELEDDLLTSAMEMNDHHTELESVQYAVSHIQHEIKALQENRQPLSANASRTLQLLTEKKLELAQMHKHLEEAKDTYRQAIEKFFMARDNFSQIGFDVPADEGPRRSQRVRKTPEWQFNYV